ncbi:MAG: tRNA 2-selenouridine(34) synthase MnmH, partial [Bacteroidales bacterium]|nr:tRNA 2-selenouridine(34) synthase MnmH [Bacteroidales bacterium]
MPVTLDIEDFLLKTEEIHVVDVRSPAEFQKGHLPGAINLPLFSD